MLPPSGITHDEKHQGGNTSEGAPPGHQCVACGRNTPTVYPGTSETPAGVPQPSGFSCRPERHASDASGTSPGRSHSLVAHIEAPRLGPRQLEGPTGKGVWRRRRRRGQPLHHLLPGNSRSLTPHTSSAPRRLAPHVRR